MTLGILAKRKPQSASRLAPRKLEKSKARTSFYFSPLASEQLDSLKARTRLSSPSDVLDAALSILVQTIEFVRAGGQIFIKAGKDKKVWAYSPYTPPRDYPHFSPSWSVPSDDEVKARHSFTFSEDMLGQVEAIRRFSRFQSLSDVVRAAIAVLNELLSVHEAGDLIIVRDKSGTRPYTLFSSGLGSGRADRRPIRSTKIANFEDLKRSKMRPPASPAPAQARASRRKRG